MGTMFCKMLTVGEIGWGYTGTLCPIFATCKQEGSVITRQVDFEKGESAETFYERLEVRRAASQMLPAVEP